MNRRRFLRDTLVHGALMLGSSTSALGLSGFLFGLLGGSRQAWAIGGVLPEIDAAAPNFQLPAVVPPSWNGGSGSGTTSLSLNDFAGRWLVLYFYPKDFTGGCTLEARGFQADLATYHALDAEVAGISADAVDQHASFCDSEGLAFPLLSDPGGEVSRRYGSWIAPFSQRHTFLIDPDGVLRARWVAVRPLGHSAEVLSELRGLQSGSIS